MEKQFYITDEEREKCRRVIDAFAELYEIEDEDILLVDAGRYGFVKLQCYTNLTGKPALLPQWTYGLWLSTSFTTNYDEETVMSFIDGMAVGYVAARNGTCRLYKSRCL